MRKLIVKKLKLEDIINFKGLIPAILYEKSKTIII
jgi:hypothetical protein